MTTPIEQMITAAVRCVICDAPMGKCDCWTECRCGWRFRKGTKCKNPEHGGSGELEIVAAR